MVFDNDLLEFIQSVEWTSAKTMPEWPLGKISKKGKAKRYVQKSQWSFYQLETFIKYKANRGLLHINRLIQTEDTFEGRKREGRLPK